MRHALECDQHGRWQAGRGCFEEQGNAASGGGQAAAGIREATLRSELEKGTHLALVWGSRSRPPGCGRRPMPVSNISGSDVRTDAAGPGGQQPADADRGRRQRGVRPLRLRGEPGRRIIRVLKAEGRHTRIRGCWFQGFDEPLAQSLFPGADVEVSQTMFVRPPEGDNAAGWPLSVKSLGVNRKGVPKVTFDQ